MIVSLISLVILYFLYKRIILVKGIRETALYNTREKARMAAKNAEKWEHFYDQLNNYPSFTHMVINIRWWKFIDFYPNL